MTDILLNAGVRTVIGCDSGGAIYDGREGLNPVKQAYRRAHEPRAACTGTADEVLAGADVYLGLSMPGAVSRAGIERMADDAIVFAMANPTPEIAPEDLPPGKVAVVATGRSDYPNQINNVLAFPGVFRGALDVRASTITEGMKVAAGHAIASVIADDELGPEYVIPSVFNRDVALAVAAAVAEAAERGRRRAGRGLGGRAASLSPPYSYCSASSGSSFAARRAGKIAARMPTKIDAIAKMMSCVHGITNTISLTRAASRPPSTSPRTIPSSGSDQRRDHALVPDHPPRLPSGQPDRPQHADLTRALVDRQHERVDDPEDADDDREREQDVEDVQHLLEAGDLIVGELLPRLRLRVRERLQATR